MQKKLDETLRQRAESEKEIERLQREVCKLREQVNRLQQQLGDTSQLKSHGDTLIAEISSKDDVIKQLSSELQDLSCKLALNESQATKLTSLEEKRVSLAAENVKLAAALLEKAQLIDKLKGEKECLENRLNQMIRQLEDKVHELRAINTDKLDLENQLSRNSQLPNTQGTGTAEELLNRTRNELESFHLKHVSCLRDLWNISQGTTTPRDPSFNPTYEQVREAISQRIQTGNIAKSNSYMLSHSLPTTANSSPNATLLSITPTAFSHHSPENPPSLISFRSSPFTGDVVSLQERVREIQIWYLSAQYTTKPTCQAWKQHLSGLENKIGRQLADMNAALSRGETVQAAKLLKRLKNKIEVLSNCSVTVGKLEHECNDLDNYRVLLEYIDFLQRGAPHNRSTESLLSRNRQNGVEDPLIALAENGNGRQLFKQDYDPYPDFRNEIDHLKQTEQILQKRADALTSTVKAINPVKSGVTFRGIVVNLHFTLLLFFLLAFAYILIGPFPQSLPIIRHKLFNGQTFSLMSYFYDPSDFKPSI